MSADGFVRFATRCHASVTSRGSQYQLLRGGWSACGDLQSIRTGCESALRQPRTEPGRPLRHRTAAPAVRVPLAAGIGVTTDAGAPPSPGRRARPATANRSHQNDLSAHVTLLTAADQGLADGEVSAGLPSDLLGLSARRLQVLALLYALVFFLAGIFPALILPDERARFLGDVVQWAPGVIGIVVAVLLAVVIRRVPPRRAMTLGLVFEIVSSYAIAAAEFGDPSGLEMHQGYMGLSWVAVWVVLFTIVVPTSPRRALIAALASLSSVSVVVGLLIATGVTTLRVPPALFFFGLIFPYLLVAGMAWVGARVVYHLGIEVRRARELGSYQLEEAAREGWAKCGAPGTGCWPGRRPSS